MAPVTPWQPAHLPPSATRSLHPKSGSAEKGAGGGCSGTPGRKCQKSHQFLVAPVVLVALPIQPLRQQLQRHKTPTSDHRAGLGWGAAGRGPQSGGGERPRTRSRGGTRRGPPRNTDLVLLQLLHQHLQPTRHAVRGAGAAPQSTPRPAPATPGGGGAGTQAKATAAARGARTHLGGSPTRAGR